MPQRGIDTGLWSNLDFADISINGKLLFIYLCTTFRGNQAGLYRISLEQISFDTKIPIEDIPSLFDEIKPMDVEWYPEKKMVWVKEFLKHQAHSPQFLKAVANNLESIRYPELIIGYIEYNHTVSIPYQYTKDTIPLTETESVLETESVSVKIPYQNIVDLYNSICISMPKVKDITSKRRKAIASIYNKDPDIFEELFKKAEASPFLTGRQKGNNGSHDNWRCGFDWLLIEGNRIKVLEGNYDALSLSKETTEWNMRG